MEEGLLEFKIHNSDSRIITVTIDYNLLYSFLNFRFKDFMNEYRDYLVPRSYDMPKSELNEYIDSEYYNLVCMLQKLPFEVYRFTFIATDNILKLEGFTDYSPNKKPFLFFVYPYEKADSEFKNNVKLVENTEISLIAGMLDSFIERRKEEDPEFNLKRYSIETLLGKWVFEPK